MESTLLSRIWTHSWLLVLFSTSQLSAAETLASLPTGEPQLSLPGIDGEAVPIAGPESTRLTVLCFLGTECPLARLYGPRLEQLSQQYHQAGVRFVGVNSNRQDSLDEVRQYAQDYALTFPLAKDYDQQAANRFEITRTPEVCVVDAEGRIRYRGRIDDQYLPGLSRPAPTRNDLSAAIEELLAGKAVSVSETPPVGCLIGRIPQVTAPTELTYCRDISRVLQQHCVECHRTGDIGPFALTDYDEVVGWGDMMLEVIADGRMPPWHATENSGPFINAREMPSSDKQALREWVAGGMPFGSVDDLPPPVAEREKWDLGREPDLVVSMREEPFVVPAEGVIDYQYFVVDPGFTEDRWVSGAEVLPGNRSVVHHCIVFIRPPDGTKLPGLGWLTAYVPGQRAFAMPPGMGRRVPAGSRLVFQMHYTPNGSEQSDRTQLGLLFADESTINEEVYTLMAINQNFEIPPGAADHPVDAVLDKLPRDGRLLAMAPHMHIRGKSCRVVARTGSYARTLLDVPRYDFNWQHVYAFENSIPLNSLDAIEFTAHFDNSAENPVNPDPAQFVHWGDQTWEEMTVAFFEVARPRGSKQGDAQRAKATRPREPTPDDEKFVDDFFVRCDANEDGRIDNSEVPLAVKRFGFRRLDLNGDGYLDRSEIAEQARRDGKF
ncbi:MAG: redoxin domain-containing protein [Planctomycetaceae bacterium]|nr:redoxin domain-containing protein [Planctomycetaceae bacterium]